MMKRVMWAGLALLLVLVVFWDAGGVEEPEADSEATVPHWVGVDAGTRLACEEFYSASVDTRDGLLTPDELRERLKKVNEYASGSTRDDVRSLGREVLGSFTSGTADEFSEALARMTALCNDAIMSDGSS